MILYTCFRKNQGVIAYLFIIFAKKRGVPTQLDGETRMLLERKYILGYENEELGRMLGCRTDSVQKEQQRQKLCCSFYMFW